MYAKILYAFTYVCTDAAFRTLSFAHDITVGFKN